MCSFRTVIWSISICKSGLQAYTCNSRTVLWSISISKGSSRSVCVHVTPWQWSGLSVSVHVHATPGNGPLYWQIIFLVLWPTSVKTPGFTTPCQIWSFFYDRHYMLLYISHPSVNTFFVYIYEDCSREAPLYLEIPSHWLFMTMKY